jgi:hypothetical protein
MESKNSINNYYPRSNLNHLDSLCLHKIFSYLNILQIHPLKSISPTLLAFSEQFLPYTFYHQNWFKTLHRCYLFFLVDECSEESDPPFTLNQYLNEATKESITSAILPPRMELLLIDAAKSGNLKTLKWIRTTFFNTLQLFDLRRLARCLTYTAHHHNLKMVDYILHQIVIFPLDLIAHPLPQHPLLYRTYIETIRFKNHQLFQYLWKDFPLMNKKLIDQLLTNCEIYHSISIYFILINFLQNHHQSF